jgi:hypothetical protein
MEYEGALGLNKQLVADLLKAAEIVRAKIENLGPVPADKRPQATIRSGIVAGTTDKPAKFQH